ncbi:MAG TPA: glycosyltransferase family 39 protein [Chitinophagaceae bacterium]|nr:glycosyltransferase family 39 protein [Chitinophagaceae bacterium]
MTRPRNILYLLALVKLILPFFLQNSFYEPHRDEFLYLAEGRHLAWGFMEVPPLLSVFAWLTHLFGDSMFWIKLWPSLFGTATFIMAGEIVLSLGGKAFTLVLLFLPFIFGVSLRVFFLFQPNPPEIFFWTMIVYSMTRFIQTEKTKWLYVFGISLGLGMMSKYSAAFFTVSILLGLLFTEQRRMFLNKHFWYASLIALIIFLPNLLWQYNHKFPVVHHMRELQQTQLQYINPSDFLMHQLLMNLPCIFIWITGLWYLSFSSGTKKYRFIGLSYAILIILLLIGHGKDYYALGAYPALFAFGAYRLEQFTAVKRRILRVVFVAVPIFVGALMIPIALPVFPPQRLASFYETMNTKATGALKWEDLKNHPLPQDFADMLGWEEMAQKMSKAYETLDSNEKEHTLLFCDNYGMAGAITFYAKKYHLPEAYSDNASFLYWLPQEVRIENVLLITDDKNEMQHDFIKDFSYAVVTDSVTAPMAREHGDLIVLLKGANDNFNQFFKRKIEEDKAALR